MAFLLVITPQDDERIKEAIEAAQAMPMPLEEVTRRKFEDQDPAITHRSLAERIKAQFEPWPGRQQLLLNEDGPAENVITCNLSIEEQPPGKVKHLSLSIGDGSMLPNPDAVHFIARAFGITTPLVFFVEEFEPDKMCVNVIGFDDEAILLVGPGRVN